MNKHVSYFIIFLLFNAIWQLHATKEDLIKAVDHATFEQVLNKMLETQNINDPIEGKTILLWVAEESPAAPALPDNILALLIKGADVNIAGPEGKTPLLALLERAEAPEDTEQENALLFSIQNLLMEGPDLSVTYNGQNAFTLAEKITQEALKDTILMLLHEEKEKAQRKKPTTENIIQAILKDHPDNEIYSLINQASKDVLNTVIEKTTSGRIVRKIFQSPLQVAIAKKRLNILQALIDKGANVNAMIGTMPALFYVQDLETLKTLVNNGANLNLTGPYHRNFLMFLLHHRKDDFDFENIIPYLIQHGINLNAQEDQGYTALIYAMNRIKTFFNPEQIKFLVDILLQHGANPYIKNLAGQTAIDYAKQTILIEELRDEIITMFEKKSIPSKPISENLPQQLMTLIKTLQEIKKQLR